LIQIVLKQFNDISGSDKQKLYIHIFKKSDSNTTESEITTFTNRTQAWCLRTKSEYYGIFFQNEIVGTISLSKQNISEKTGCIGYEVFEEFRERGITNQAFELVLEIARKKGFEIVKATIAIDNIASLKIWQKRGAEFRELAGSKLEACLEVKEYFHAKGAEEEENIRI